MSLDDHEFEFYFDDELWPRSRSCQSWMLFLICHRDAASRRDVLSVIELLAQTQPHAIGAHLPINLLTCGIVSKGIMPGYDYKIPMLASFSLTLL